MKTAECNIPASCKNKPFYSKIYSIYQTDQIYLDIWRRVYNVLNEIYFKLLRMLPLKAIFQSLDGIFFFFLFYFTWNFSYIHAKSARISNGLMDSTPGV